MKTYFGINRKFAKGAFKIALNYSLEEVPDTLALNRQDPTPVDFLEKFSCAKTGGEQMEDMVANSLGWKIVSDRLVQMFKSCANFKDIELIPLPDKAVQLDGRLGEYRVLGIKRHIECVNYDHSDILWTSSGEHILSFRECVLNSDSIPIDTDIFLIEEYPVFPVISAELAIKMAEIRPTGFTFEKIRAV